jgi:hypothetical protein
VSSNFTQDHFSGGTSLSRLCLVAKDAKLLTVKFSAQMLAEFAAAAEINRARSVSEAVHQYVVATILETKSHTPAKQWDALVKEKMRIIQMRSESRIAKTLDPETRQRQALDRLVFAEAKTIPETAKPKRKASGHK